MSAMLFFRFYAALTGLLHGNYCFFARRSPFFGNPIIKYTKIYTGVSYLSAMRLLPAILLHLKWQVEKVNAAHPDKSGSPTAMNVNIACLQKDICSRRTLEENVDPVSFYCDRDAPSDNYHT